MQEPVASLDMSCVVSADFVLVGDRHLLNARQPEVRSSFSPSRQASWNAGENEGKLPCHKFRCEGCRGRGFVSLATPIRPATKRSRNCRCSERWDKQLNAYTVLDRQQRVPGRV